MHYGFDTEDASAATGALLIYAVYRSRDRKRYKVTPDMWGQIERFTKAAAKRAATLPAFLEALKPRLCCDSLRPAAMQAGLSGMLTLAARTNAAGGTEYVQMGDDGERREFLTQALSRVNARQTLDLLYRETAWIVLLVRDRLEREKPIEKAFETELETIV